MIDNNIVNKVQNDNITWMKNKGKVNDCTTIKTSATKDNILFIKLKKILLNNTLWCWECQGWLFTPSPLFYKEVGLTTLLIQKPPL